MVEKETHIESMEQKVLKDLGLYEENGMRDGAPIHSEWFKV